MGIRRHRGGAARGEKGARNPTPIARLGLAAAFAATAVAAHAEAGGTAAEAKAEAEAPPCRHAYAFLGEPKLPPDFEHFDWVNPDAPKGGLMRMADTGSWDTFNRMSLGHSVRGMDTRGNSTRHIYDSLVIRNPTEPATVYGLIAECIAVAPDGAWVEFRLRDGVYWHDGEPLDAEDVAFSFHVYQDRAHPAIAVAVAGFSGVEILDGNRVRYHVRPGHRHNRLLPIRIGELPVLSKRYWTQPGNDPGKPAATPPLGSGPYRIGGYEFGRWILWERDPDYWGRDLPPSRGRYNFDRVKYDYFRDDQMRTEAVKGDIVDIHVENVPRRWATAYDFPPADAGVFRLEILPQSKPRILWWPIFWNQRQARFRDIRVREALWLLNDFTWSNRRLGYGFYDVATSFFYGSPLAATGLPNERELELLEPIRHLVPPRVFTEPYAPPPHQGSGWHRDNLLRAAGLLRQAGWVVEDKRLVHERTGEPFFIRFLAFSPALARSLIPYTRVLKRLGIESSVKSPELSNWLYRMRSGDFDAGLNWFRPDNTPTLMVTNTFSTAAADQDLSANWGNIRDPAIDRLIEAMQSATTYPDYVAAVRAVDRVLLWNFYYVPGMTKVKQGVAYWDRYGQPPATPLDRDAFIDSWWWDPVKARAVAEFTGRE